MRARTPSAVDLRRARRRTIADVIAPRLRVLFSGINPGVYSAAIGHHFGRPGNRFWKALHAASTSTSSCSRSSATSSSWGTATAAW